MIRRNSRRKPECRSCVSDVAQVQGLRPVSWVDVDSGCETADSWLLTADIPRFAHVAIRASADSRILERELLRIWLHPRSAGCAVEDARQWS